MVKITKILINYQKRPIGLTSIDQVGWSIESDQKEVFQKSYHLQISEDSEFTKSVYDSGVVETRESMHVSIPDDICCLRSSRKYYIRVKTMTNVGASEWAMDEFITGLIGDDKWQASFITIETEADKEASKGFYLRKTWHFEKPVKAAYIHTTALGLYHLYINGKKVGNDQFAPGWTSYLKHLLYQTYDVTGYLNDGQNTVGAMIGAGWYKGTMGFVRMRNHYGDRAAFGGQLVVEYQDGSREAFVTDDTWQGEWGPVIFSEIYDGETYDAGLEIPGWNENSCKYTNWQTAAVVTADTAVLASQSGGTVKEITKIPAKDVITTPDGDTVIDFGQNTTGWVAFRVKGKRGDRVELKCFEILDAGGNVYLDNLRSAKQTVTYILKDDQEAVFHPYFSFQGFQYAKVVTYPGEVKPENFTAWAVHSEMEPTGEFECSNPNINQLQHNILWGMKGNFLDVPTDCPQRDERLGWTGDAQIFCRTASFLMDTYTFFSKWLRDVAADQTKEGGVPHVVPDILINKSAGDRLMKDGDHSAAAWADVAVIMPWTLYLTYGDTNIIERQYESMKAWIGFMEQHAVNYIWNYKLQFGDWVALDAKEGSYFGATPTDLTCTAYFAYSTGLFAKMAGVIGHTEDAEYYNKLHKDIVKAYWQTFFDAGGHLKAQTQTAQIITLYFNLAPADLQQNVTDDLLKLLAKENGHLVTGFIGTPYFCHALSQNGHTKEAYELLLKDDFPSWLYQVKQGATTIWEHWDGLKPDGTMWSPDMNSFNHYVYGAIGDWLYRVAAGIECDEAQPGYRHIVFAPHPGGGLSYAAAAYQSIYGKIVSRWQDNGQEVTVNISIPCNTTADIQLTDADEILEGDGLIFKGDQLKTAVGIGSGSYTIRYRKK